jgi:hypothetical protein
MEDRIAPMVRLVPCLGALTRLSSLEIEADYDTDRRGWLLACRAVFGGGLSSLKRLSLSDGAWSRSESIMHTPTLPPSLSLLTALEELEVRAFALASAGPVRRMGQLRRLVILLVCNQAENDAHAPVSGRDLAALSRLEFLALSHPERCYAQAIASGLPRLATLVLDRFWCRQLVEAALQRVTQRGTAVYEGKLY